MLSNWKSVSSYLPESSMSWSLDLAFLSGPCWMAADIGMPRIVSD